VENVPRANDPLTRMGDVTTSMWILSIKTSVHGVRLLVAWRDDVARDADARIPVSNTEDAVAHLREFIARTERLRSGGVE
jgi:hypothetical protein